MFPRTTSAFTIVALPCFRQCTSYDESSFTKTLFLTMIRTLQNAATRVSLVSLLFGCLWVLILAHAVSQMIVSPTGHDQLWLLFAAERMLHGAQLDGPHLVETNPPLIVWFSALPVLLSKLSHLTPPAALRILVIGLILGSIGWCARLLRLHPRRLSRASLVLFGCALLIVEFPEWYRFFGQREHLFIIFTLPYIIAVASGVTERLRTPERCALGVAAGLGVCFKPHQVMVLVAAEVFLAFYRRRLDRIASAELLCAVLTGVSYLVAIRLLAPMYYSQTVPLLLNTYWAFGTYTTTALLLGKKSVLLLLGAICILIASIIGRRYMRQHMTVFVLLVCSVAGSFAYDMQHTGWGYQFYPALAFLALAVLALLIDFLEMFLAEYDPRFKISPYIAALIVAIVAITIATQILHARKQMPSGPSPSPFDAVLAQARPADSVYIFSTTVPAFASVYQHHLEWGSRFAHLWMIPAIVRNESGPQTPPFKRLPPATITKLADVQRTELAEDLDYWKPKFVIVEQCSPDAPCDFIEAKNFRMLRWFLESSRFATAWSHYRQEPGVPGYDAYVRIP